MTVPTCCSAFQRRAGAQLVSQLSCGSCDLQNVQSAATSIYALVPNGQKPKTGSLITRWSSVPHCTPRPVRALPTTYGASSQQTQGDVTVGLCRVMPFVVRKVLQKAAKVAKLPLPDSDRLLSDLLPWTWMVSRPAISSHSCHAIKIHPVISSSVVLTDKQGWEYRRMPEIVKP